MKKLVPLFLGLAMSVAFAQEEKVDAPQAVIDEAKQLCEKYAEEDGIAAEDLDSFLLECVNEELEAEGYNKIESLD